MILEEGLIGLHQPWWALFFAFIIGHALGDYPLQGDFLAIRKNHRLPPDFPKIPDQPSALWAHCLTAHALIQAGIVWMVSGLVILGLIEFVLHWVIDFLKSEGWTNFHLDQSLHVVCKLIYVIVICTHPSWLQLG